MSGMCFMSGRCIMLDESARDNDIGGMVQSLRKSWPMSDVTELPWYMGPAIGREAEADFDEMEELMGLLP